MNGLWDALRRLLEVLIAYLAGKTVERAQSRAEAAEGNSEALSRAMAAVAAADRVSNAELADRLRERGLLRHIPGKPADD